MAQDTRAHARSGTTSSAEGRRPFVLAPFRGLRFDPAQVGDLGSVISPPYDVLDADTVRDLEEANRRNIVRLILSRRYERPYLAVRTRLQQWRDRGYLCADPVPGLYLYQYTVDQATVRGLIGLAALRQEPERVILPHEDVMRGPVEDRTVLMRTTRTNLEPILLVHEGTHRLRTLIGTAAQQQPLARFQALDGSAHELWQLTDPQTLSAVAREIADSQVLIADGHHRYAAYLQLQQQLRDPGLPMEQSPWDFGLAMLVDQQDYSLRVGPIHRSVAALTISDVQELAGERGDGFSVHPDRETAFAERATRAERPGTAAFVLSDGRVWAVLSTPRTHAVDAAVLHGTLLPAWHIADEQLSYHHSLDQALHTTTRQPGLVVAVEPPTMQDVMRTAAAGMRMPRKSTSFHPKPRMGVVMRDLHDG
ncbi:MAG TPA: DUF1015 domain-containing protein [Nocardioidaceae bacterium]|jgi:uncharacterized protein (DUF1015 family)